MRSDFWRGRRVLVTGHTGFKGGWLSLWLQSMGAEVAGYALPPPTNPSLFDKASVSRGMVASCMADVRDLGLLKKALLDHRPEVIFHLAAQALVRPSYTNPVDTFATNVMGTANLLEAVRTTDGGVRVVLNVTTDKCYDNREWLWGYREIDPLGGHDPYSSSKACSELVTSAYRDSFFNATNGPEFKVCLASARAGNVIGGGDWALDRLIPDLMRAFTAGDQVVIRNPHAVRPWQHVLEPLHGYLSLAERLWEQGFDFAESWNFGPAEGDAQSVQWLVQRIVGEWGHGASWRLDDRPQPHEATNLRLDCTKARARLGWHPRWNLQTALHHTVDWYLACERGEDMRQWTLHQIAAFTEAGA